MLTVMPGRGYNKPATSSAAIRAAVHVHRLLIVSSGHASPGGRRRTSSSATRPGSAHLAYLALHSKKPYADTSPVVDVARALATRLGLASNLGPSVRAGGAVVRERESAF
jgi:hypothetical protein